MSLRMKYVEQELAKKRGGNVDTTNHVENDVKRAEDEYIVFKLECKKKIVKEWRTFTSFINWMVKRRNSEESSTQWTTGIAGVQLPLEYKLRNIEETGVAKKLLQEKRFMGKSKTEANTSSSYSADYFHRGRDYAEKLRRGRRQAATDEFMLERFCKRERQCRNSVVSISRGYNWVLLSALVVVLALVSRMDSDLLAIPHAAEGAFTVGHIGFCNLFDLEE
ncbi:Telomere length and silencing protein 1, partial [Dillenia turbinata]